MTSLAQARKNTVYFNSGPCALSRRSLDGRSAPLGRKVAPIAFFVDLGSCRIGGAGLSATPDRVAMTSLSADARNVGAMLHTGIVAT